MFCGAAQCVISPKFQSSQLLFFCGPTSFLCHHVKVNLSADPSSQSSFSISFPPFVFSFCPPLRVFLSFHCSITTFNAVALHSFVESYLDAVKNLSKSNRFSYFPRPGLRIFIEALVSLDNLEPKQSFFIHQNFLISLFFLDYFYATLKGKCRVDLSESFFTYFINVHI